MGDPFLERVFERLPAVKGRSGFEYHGWRIPGRPTSEAIGVRRAPVDVDRLVARVTDFDHYVGNIDHVVESREVTGSDGPGRLLYQRIHLPLLGDLQLVNRLEDLGEVAGWRVLVWHLDQERTASLDARRGGRFDYNDGAWLIKPDQVAYAFAGAPLKEDVGRVRYTLMTRGGDATAPAVTRSTINGMLAWLDRSGT